jgi:ABC-type bacteriocin/lantibiotic exporter with double-glycine peptidase domain
MEQIIETLTSNPIYLVVAVVLALIILFGVVKKIFKLALIVLALLVLFVAYMVVTGKEVTVKSVQEELQATGKKLGKTVEGVKEKISDDALEKILNK